MALLPGAFPRRAIIGLDLVPSNTRGRPRVRAGNLLNLTRTKKMIRQIQPSLVFHLAGVPATANKKDLKNAFIDTTRNLLTALKSHQGNRCRLILASSVTVYGRPRKTRSLLSEKSPAAPLTDYANIKWAQEKLCLAAQNNQLDVVVARIFNLVGPSCSPHLFAGSMSHQIVRIEKNLVPPEIKTGNLNNVRDFIDIRDAASALIALAQSGQAGQAYNVCSGRGTKLKNILGQLVRLSKARHKIRIITEASRLRQKTRDARVLVGSHKKIARATRWTPKISLKKSLFDTLQSYRDRP